jgi:hypothetical protein
MGCEGLTRSKRSQLRRHAGNASRVSSSLQPSSPANLVTRGASTDSWATTVGTAIATRARVGCAGKRTAAGPATRPRVLAQAGLKQRTIRKIWDDASLLVRRYKACGLNASRSVKTAGDRTPTKRYRHLVVANSQPSTTRFARHLQVLTRAANEARSGGTAQSEQCARRSLFERALSMTVIR